VASAKVIMQISGKAKFTSNEAVEAGGVIYLGEGAKARFIDKALFRANIAATGGSVFLAKGSQVELTKYLYFVCCS
jgi:predicted outer membrane repeat protein